MTKDALLSDTLAASFKFSPKLFSQEEELHERVEAADAMIKPKACLSVCL